MNDTNNDALAHRSSRSERGANQGPDVDRTHLGSVWRSVRGVPSRRDVLRGLATTGLGLGLAWLPPRAEAKPKRRKQRKKLKPGTPNIYGCLEVNEVCRRHSQCCSGICTGQPGRKRCRAHGAGTCSQDREGACLSIDAAILPCNSDDNCRCFRTTANSNFCGNWFGYKACASCTRDADCLALGLPVGSACIRADGHCAVADCASGMVCVAPCGVEPPPTM